MPIYALAPMPRSFHPKSRGWPPEPAGPELWLPLHGFAPYSTTTNLERRLKPPTLLSAPQVIPCHHASAHPLLLAAGFPPRPDPLPGAEDPVLVLLGCTARCTRQVSTRPASLFPIHSHLEDQLLKAPDSAPLAPHPQGHSA